MNIAAVIPARYASTRFPGKPLASICGKPMIQRVYENVLACRALDRVVVATDSPEIARAVEAFGGLFEPIVFALGHAAGARRVIGAAASRKRGERGQRQSAARLIEAQRARAGASGHAPRIVGAGSNGKGRHAIA